MLRKYSFLGVRINYLHQKCILFFLYTASIKLRGNPCVICHHFHRLRHPGTQASSLMDTLRTLNKLGPRITARVLDRER